MGYSVSFDITAFDGLSDEEVEELVDDDELEGGEKVAEAAATKVSRMDDAEFRELFSDVEVISVIDGSTGQRIYERD